MNDPSVPQESPSDQPNVAAFNSLRTQARNMLSQQKSFEQANAEVRDLIMKEISSLREIAPDEYAAMVENGKIMADKLAARLQSSLIGRQSLDDPQILPIIAAAVVETGAVVVGIVAGEIAAQRAA